jgi:hypothetical protein
VIGEVFEDTIVSGLIPPPGATAEQHRDALDNLRYLGDKLDPALLPDQHRLLVESAKIYAIDTDWGGALSETALLEFLRDDRAAPEVSARFLSLYAEASFRAVTQAEFRFALKRFVAKKRDDFFMEILTTASTIQVSGAKVGKVELKGFDDAQAYLRKRLADLDRGYSLDAVPEGEVRSEALEVVEQYDRRKTQPESFVGIKSGLPWVDTATNGLQNGEFGVVAGYTEQGKTHMCIQWGHHAATVQGKNIAFAIPEMTKEQYRNRIAIRHMRNPKFGTPNGIDGQRFKNGTLTPDEETALKAAMTDLQNNPAYGRIYVFQVPEKGGLDYVLSKAAFLDSLWADSGGLHGLFIDSISMLAMDSGIEHTRMALNAAIKQTSSAAKSFRAGRGLPIITTWHANRKSYAEACEKGYYTNRSWSEADGLEKWCDFLLWLLIKPNQLDTHEIISGIGKYRSGPSHEIRTLYEDFGTGYIGMVESGYDQQVDTSPGVGAYGIY